MHNSLDAAVTGPSIAFTESASVPHGHVKARALLDDNSPVQTASLQDLRALPDSTLRDACESVLSVCQALTIPANLRNDSWKYDGAALAALSQWCSVELPALLNELQEGLERFFIPRTGPGDGNVEAVRLLLTSQEMEYLQSTLMSAMYAAARFLLPGPSHQVRSAKAESEPCDYLEELLSPDNRDVPSFDGDVWCSDRAQDSAQEIIRTARTVLSSLCDSQHEGIHEMIASHLLSQRIRPLFQSATSSRSARLNQDSARPRHRDANIVVHSMLGEHSAHEDDVIWKGGGAESGDSRFFRSVAGEGTGAEHVNLRSEALGCWNVLYFALQCVGQAAMARPAGSSDPWETLLPLVLPPLLSIMDDPSPAMRLKGARILRYGALLSEDEGGITTSLLLRTGVTPILLGSLETSLTYANDGRSAIGSRLLDAAIASSRLLILRATFPLQRHAPSTGFQHTDDGGEGRAAQLSDLVRDGIFRVWTYLPAIVPTGSSGSTAGPSPTAATLHVTSMWLGVVASDLGPLTARHSSTAIDFLSAHITLGGLVGRPSAVDIRAERTRHIVSLSALQALRCVLAASTGIYLDQESNSLAVPPGLSAWTNRMLAAVCKCWTELADWEAAERVDLRGERGKEETQGVEKLKLELREALKKAWRQISLIDPKGSAAFGAIVKDLDGPLFSPLLQ